MPELQEINKEVRRLVANGQLERALDYLISHGDDYSAEFADVAFLKEKLEKLEQKNTRDKIGRKDYNIECNKIAFAILKIIKSLDNTSTTDELKHDYIIQEAERLLENKDLAKVLDFLSSELKGNSEMENTLTLLYARWNSLLKEKKIGVIDKKQFKIRRKLIKEALAMIIEDIDTKGLPKAENEGSSIGAPKKKKKNKESNLLLRAILILQIPIIMGIAYIIFHLPA